MVKPRNLIPSDDVLLYDVCDAVFFKVKNHTPTKNVHQKKKGKKNKKVLGVPVFLLVAIGFKTSNSLERKT